MEPRKFTRYAVQLPALFSAEERSGEGTVFDLSTEGCAVLSDERLAISTYLSLRIDLPGDAAPLVIDLAAVRWTSEGRLGLEFIRVAPMELDRLRELVTTLEVDTEV